MTSLLGDDAVRFIDAQNAKKPFFMYLAFTAPHTSYQAPQEYIERYRQISDPNRRIYASMITAMDDQTRSGRRDTVDAQRPARRDGEKN